MASRTVALAAALLLLSGCGAEGAGPGASGQGGGAISGPPPAARQAALRITTQLGEQCPHIPVTPDPRCEPRPRPGTARNGYEVS